MKAIYKYDECGDLQHLRDLPSWSTDEECAQMVELYKWQNPEAQRVFWADFEAEAQNRLDWERFYEHYSWLCAHGECEEYEDYLCDCEDEGIEPLEADEWIEQLYEELEG